MDSGHYLCRNAIINFQSENILLSSNAIVQYLRPPGGVFIIYHSADSDPPGPGVGHDDLDVGGVSGGGGVDQLSRVRLSCSDSDLSVRSLSTWDSSQPGSLWCHGTCSYCDGQLP